MAFTLTRKQNGILYWGGFTFLILTLIFQKGTTVSTVLLIIGLSSFISSQLLFLIREPFSTLKSKAFLWTIIPLTINTLLDKLSMHLFKQDKPNIAMLIVVLMFVIGGYAIIRKLNLKERMFWY